MSRTNTPKPIATGAGLWRHLVRLHTDESGSSEIETVLLTAFIVLPLLVLPPLVMDANATVFDRIAPWTNLPFP